MTKNHYETMIENERRILDDDIDMLKTQREEENAMYEQYKSEYEIEINDMVRHQQEEINELEIVYKEELEAKDKEFLELMLKFDNLLKLW